MATLSERIVGAEAGTYVDREVGRTYVHDATGIQTKRDLGRSRHKRIEVD